MDPVLSQMNPAHILKSYLHLGVPSCDFLSGFLASLFHSGMCLGIFIFLTTEMQTSNYSEYKIIISSYNYL